MYQKYYNVFKFQKDNIYFFSVPKNACSSIKKWHAGYVRGEDVDVPINNQDILHLPSFNKLIPHSNLNADAFNNDMNNPDVAKFVILRDPYDRAYSCFKEKMKQDGLDYYKYFRSLVCPEIKDELYRMNEKQLIHSQNDYKFLRFLVEVKKQNRFERNEHYIEQNILCCNLEPKNISVFTLDNMQKLEKWLSEKLNKEVTIQKYSPHKTDTNNIKDNLLDGERLLIEQIYHKDIELYEKIKA